MSVNLSSAFFRALLRPIIGACLLLGSISCSHTKLDDSFGIRNREIFRVQNAQRTPREIVNSGQAAESAMAKLYQKLAPSENGGGQSASTPTTPLKIPGLSR